MSQPSPRGSAPRHACPACSGDAAPPCSTALGLEPTALERELAHTPGCPRRAREPRALRYARALLLASIPAFGVQACAPEPLGDGTSVGLDNGTVGKAAPVPDSALTPPRDRAA